MDWLGVTSLWLGAVVIALKTGELPLPTWAPAWLASPWWAVAPLVLVTASVVLFIVRATKLFRPPYEPGEYHAAPAPAPAPAPRPQPQPQPQQSPQRDHEEDSNDDPEGVAIGCGPITMALGLVILVMLLIWGTIAGRNRITAEPLPTPPPVLQGPVTASFVAETVKTKTAVEAETSLNRFLGMPMRATGRVYSKRGERGYRLYVIGLTDPSQVPQVYMKFEGQSGLSSYHRQDHIAANCKIERLDATGIGLAGCILIEPPESSE